MSEKRLTAWEKLLKDAVEKEQFGQVEEAMDDYQTLVNQITAELKEKGPETTTADAAAERGALNKLRLVFHWRLQKLRSTQNHSPYVGGGEVSLDDVRAIKKDFRKLFAAGTSFPVDTSRLKPLPSVRPVEVEEEERPFMEESQQALLKPCPNVSSGETYLKIHLDSIGLKDVEKYVEPHILVTVRDGSGKLLEPEQQTPTPLGTRKEMTIPLNFNVYVQTALDKLPNDAGVFFEFRHFKAKQKKISTRCWCLLTMGEVKDGPAQLQILAKPADFSRKKMFKHSVKNLYMLIDLTILRG